MQEEHDGKWIIASGVYNFQDMTISDQCVSIQIFLKRLISIKQQAVVSKKLFALQKNFNYSKLIWKPSCVKG